MSPIRPPGLATCVRGAPSKGAISCKTVAGISLRLDAVARPCRKSGIATHYDLGLHCIYLRRGWGSRLRTYTPPGNSRALCQLSYTPVRYYSAKSRPKGRELHPRRRALQARALLTELPFGEATDGTNSAQEQLPGAQSPTCKEGPALPANDYSVDDRSLVARPGIEPGVSRFRAGRVASYTIQQSRITWSATRFPSGLTPSFRRSSPA